MKTPKIVLALIALAPFFIPPVITSTGNAQIASGGPAQQGPTNGQPGNEALKQCIEKVKSDRARLKQDKLTIAQLRQNQTGGNGNQGELQGLKEQLHQDRKTMREDRNNCMRLHRELNKNGKNLQNTPSGANGPDDETP